jgi:GTPase Era involved in 16S rRNA processing
MRYAKWTTFNGTSPISVIKERGGDCVGVFSLNPESPDTIIGYISDESNIDSLDNFNFEEITKEQALELAQSEVPEVTLNAEGHLVFPQLTIDK